MDCQREKLLVVLNIVEVSRWPAPGEIIELRRPCRKSLSAISHRPGIHDTCAVSNNGSSSISSSAFCLRYRKCISGRTLNCISRTLKISQRIIKFSEIQKISKIRE
jgi:hypothetical protein